LWLTDVELSLQGWHTVDVRSRVVGVPSTLDETGVQLRILSDVEPPVLNATRDGATLRVEVKDRVATPEEVTVRYRLAGQEWLVLDGGGVRTASVASEIPPDALMDVEATDVAGHTSRVTLGTRAWVPAAAATARKVITPVASTSDAEGCTQAGSASLWAAAALLGLLRRRR
jgi:hypothetical protein